MSENTTSFVLRSAPPCQLQTEQLPADKMPAVRGYGANIS